MKNYKIEKSGTKKFVPKNVGWRKPKKKLYFIIKNRIKKLSMGHKIAVHSIS